MGFGEVQPAKGRRLLRSIFDQYAAFKSQSRHANMKAISRSGSDQKHRDQRKKHYHAILV